MLSSCTKSKLPTDLLSVPRALQPAKGTHLLVFAVSDQRTGAPSVSLKSLTLRADLIFVWVFPRAAQVLTWSLLFLSTWFCSGLSYSIANLQLVFSLFANLQLVFSENCSTGRCIFDVFVGGDEFHILLLYHLNLYNEMLKPCEIQNYGNIWYNRKSMWFGSHVRLDSTPNSIT